MKFAALRASGQRNDIIFDINSPLNRDNCFEPYAMLKDELSKHDITIRTSDLTDDNAPLFEIHQDVQQESKSSKNYLLLFETRFIKPNNGDLKKLSFYQKVFTWDDNIVDGDKFIKINFPNSLQIGKVDDFSSRDRFCCLISSNRSLTCSDARDLYVERVSTIRWFEKNAPQNFDLYGIDWNFPAAKSGVTGRIQRRVWRALSRVLTFKPFPSYRGRIASKNDILSNTKFSICYENVRDLPGYITEKLFDCFFAGCVPIYWGASNIEKYVPHDCFIDRRQFSNMSDLYIFLQNMSEIEYVAYQQRISDYLKSEAASPFSSHFFAETVVKTIVEDLEL